MNPSPTLTDTDLLSAALGSLEQSKFHSAVRAAALGVDAASDHSSILTMLLSHSDEKVRDTVFNAIEPLLKEAGLKRASARARPDQAEDVVQQALIDFSQKFDRESIESSKESTDKTDDEGNERHRHLLCDP